jgi:hypothetical protein
MVSSSVSYSIVPPTKYTPQVQIEMPTLEGIKFGGGHRGPVDSAMESKSFLPQMNTGTQQNYSVKLNVPDNDAAGAVSIAMIAKIPVGFELYSTGIKDAAFYPPKEVYQNQRTVDNERVLRFMNSKSDLLHQRMVGEQYKE